MNLKDFYTGDPIGDFLDKGKFLEEDVSLWDYLKDADSDQITMQRREILYNLELDKHNTKAEQRYNGFVYCFSIFNDNYRLGKCKGDFYRRHSKVEYPVEMNVINVIPCVNMDNAEKVLHDMYSDKHIRGEWFSLNNEDVDYIRRMIEFRNDEFILRPPWNSLSIKK